MTSRNWTKKVESKRRWMARVATGVILVFLQSAAGTASAYAQDVKMKANIPFNFIVSGRTLPSGEYTIRSEQGFEHALILSGRGQKPSVFLANPCLLLEAMKASQQTKLVFNRYGAQYFLSEIWMEGNKVGHQLPKSRREVEMADNETVQQVVVVAKLR